MRQVDVGEMKRLLKTLPQELYDEIEILTFTADDQARVVSKGWTPPHLLQIGSATRAHFAATYFTPLARFQFRLTQDIHDDARVMVKWLCAFEASRIAHLQEIEYVLPGSDLGRCLESGIRRGAEKYLLDSIKSWAGKLGLSDAELRAVDEVGKRVRVLHGGEAEELRPFGCWA